MIYMNLKKKSLRLRFLIEMRRHLVFRFCHSIHVHNKHTRKLIENRYKRKKSIYVVPHGNYMGYYQNQVTKSEARQNLELPDGVFIFLFLGLLRPYKGLEDLIDAFKKLKGQDFRLVIAGRVFGVDNYESKLRALSKNDLRIKLVPEFIPDEDIQVYLNACDFFVLPYKNITTSGAAALALSFGRPIITPYITSFSEIVTPEAGIMYNPNQKDALTYALQIARKKQFSESKIFEYAHQFDWKRLEHKLVTLYN